jgi:DNA repair protein RadC
MTNRLSAALGLIDIGVLDHIIVGAGKAVSMVELGVIPGAGGRA